MSITNPTFRHWNNWMGGLSDDSYILAPSQYPYGFGIDTRRFPRLVQLQRKPKIYSNANALCNAMLGTSDSKLFMACNNGDVLTANVTVWTEPSANAIFEMAEFQSNIYLFGNNNVYWITLANAGTTGASWNTHVTTIGTNSANGARNAYNWLDAKLFFTENKQLRFFDKASPTVIQDASFTCESSIVGMTAHGTALWIYCENGKMYAYDIGYDVVIGVKDFMEPINFVGRYIDIDYVFTGATAYSTMWANSGVQPGSSQIVKKVKYDPAINQIYSVSETFGFRSGTQGSQDMTVLKGVAYIGGTKGAKQCIYSYGKKGEGFPMSMNIDQVANSSAGTLDDLGAIYQHGPGYYFGWRNGTSYGIDFVDMESASLANGYVATGELLTQKDDSFNNEKTGSSTDDNEQKKEFSTMYLGASIPAGTSIDVYTLKNDEVGTGTLYASFPAATGRTHRQNIPYGDYNDVMFRIVLNGNGTSTPQLYDFKVDIHPVKWA